MSDSLNSRPNSDESIPSVPPRRSIAVLALTVILALEALVATGVSVWLVIELVTAKPESLSSAVAILLLTLGLAAALWAMVRGLLRSAAWVRSAALTWQLLQIAVAVGCFQGIFAVPTLGWALLGPALVAILLLMSPPVVAATRRTS